jgi:hypothetical protein
MAAAATITRERIERYVGLRYRPGEFDCADLVQQVLQEVFGHRILLPQDRKRPTETRAMARSIAAWTPLVAEERRLDLRHDHFVHDGDGVLLAVGQVPLHIGVAVWLTAELWVLHNDADCGSSVLTRWRDLRHAGYHVQGVYAWR